MTEDKAREYAADVASEVRDHDYWQECDCGRDEDCPECLGEGWTEL